jgi:hypothetical protein
MTSPPVVNSLANEWQEARILYPLYSALQREFMSDLPDCAALASGDDCPPQEMVEEARQWLLAADERIKVHQLRQFLQTTTLSGEPALRALLVHHLHKPEPGDSDRDKVDFLLVQYFGHCAPSPLDDHALDLQCVAHILEPVLGPVDLNVPDWLAPLGALLQEASQCPDLNSLLYSHILEKGRQIKASAGKNYYLPVALVVFARFGFIMRRTFFRLVHHDLNAVLDGLRTLEHRGVTKIDGRRAQLGAAESLDRLRMICQSWKVMFFAEYCSGQPVNILVGLRDIVEEALASSANSAPGRTQFAAAAAGGSPARFSQASADPQNDGLPK